MRTVLLGSDFMYDKDGNLKLLEMNTNVAEVGIVDIVEDIDDVYDLNNLKLFIQENNFTSVHYIGRMTIFFEKLETELSIPCTHHNVGPNQVTIPYIEDSEETLIIRSAYDITAIVDETYCSNKINTMLLTSNEPYGNPIAYIDETGNLVNNITEIIDNGVHPNFILKPSAPNYDKGIYPKLFKVTNQTELDTVLNTLVLGYFIMPFYYNPNKLVDGNRLGVIRTLNILTPPNLESTQIGVATRICRNILPVNPTYDETTLELDEIFRDSYFTFPTMRGKNEPHLRGDDMLQMEDGTFKRVDELQIGDIVRSINIPNPENVNDEDPLINYQIDYNEFKSGITFTTNTVLGIRTVNYKTTSTSVSFTDGTNLQYPRASTILSLRDNEVRFIQASKLSLTDNVIVINNENDEFSFLEKDIQSTERLTYTYDGYQINLSNTNILLKKERKFDEQLQPIGYGSVLSIEHNFFDCFIDGSCQASAACPKPYACTQGQCSCFLAT